MLEAAVHDGPKDLRFQEEIAESGTVNRHVGSLDILFGCLLVLNRSGLGLLLILVVQKIVIIGHFCVLFSFYLDLGYKDECEGCGEKRVGFCKLHVFVNENAAFFCGTGAGVPSAILFFHRTALHVFQNITKYPLQAIVLSTAVEFRKSNLPFVHVFHFKIQLLKRNLQLKNFNVTQSREKTEQCDRRVGRIFDLLSIIAGLAMENR